MWWWNVCHHDCCRRRYIRLGGIDDISDHILRGHVTNPSTIEELKFTENPADQIMRSMIKRHAITDNVHRL